MDRQGYVRSLRGAFERWEQVALAHLARGCDDTFGCFPGLVCFPMEWTGELAAALGPAAEEE